MNLFEFFTHNPKAWWAMAFVVALLVARRPTLRYIRMRIERNAADQEINHFEILRREIKELNNLLLTEQQEKRKLQEENFNLLEVIDELRGTLSRMELQIQQLTTTR